MGKHNIKEHRGLSVCFIDHKSVKTAVLKYNVRNVRYVAMFTVNKMFLFFNMDFRELEVVSECIWISDSCISERQSDAVI